MKAAFAENGLVALREVEKLHANATHALVTVKAAALNRADLLQIAGHYPPPPGESEILGMECAGIDEAGRRVCALVGSGALAEETLIERRMLMPIPDKMSFADAAAVPEAWITAHLNLFVEGQLEEGERVLIHAAASGVGTAAIQLAKRAGATVIATSRTPDKLARCLALGADEAVSDTVDLAPVDLILDALGAGMLEKNIALLKPLGRLVCIGMMQGTVGELDLRLLLSRRLRVIGSVLRSRTKDEKAIIVSRFCAEVWPGLASGELKPVIDSTFPFTDLEKAYAHLGDNKTVGKVVIAFG